MAIKSLHRILCSQGSHWVGDGFPVCSLLSYDSGLEALQSPFLLSRRQSGDWGWVRTRTGASRP
ncbi:MAG: hypothetical protein RL122_1258 [Pseudomonadota bacterium]|jgi:hypothetical protein